MRPLQIGVIIAGVLLVIAVLIYNWWQERRMRARLEARHAEPPAAQALEESERVEPTLRGLPGQGDRASDSDAVAIAEHATATGAAVAYDPSWRPPMDELPPLSSSEPAESPVAARAGDGASGRRGIVSEFSATAAPDPDIECIVVLQPAQPASAGALAAGLHARLGKAVRWYGRREPDGPWQRLQSETRGAYGEFAACMLLADRNGPASREQIDAFLALVAQVASALPARYEAPDAAFEAERGEALDKLCAELDMQIGLTLLKPSPGTIAGTRLRGVAEAGGFRLAPSGRFEWVQDETGAVLFTLQNVSDEPFTVDSLRLGSTPGVVFLLDVPRVGDPGKAFDQMKLTAKRMAHTLEAEVVDDNRSALNDAGLAAIRAQVVDAAEALRHYHIDPGSPRALKLFAA